MEWRCSWCGKPHEENDPPCDNCGHNKFERAVEQMAPETNGGPTEPVWVCAECGRQHTKNSPPCKRCGHVHLEKRQPDWEEFEDIGGTSYWDVLEPRYVVGYLLAAVLGITLLLAYTGVITLPGMGRPPVPDAPGEAEQVGALSLSDVESAYVEQLNERRDAAGVAPLDNGSDLEWYTGFVNKRTVVNATGNGPELSREEFTRVTEYCQRQPTVARYTVFATGPVEDFENESALAATLLDSWDGRDDALTESQTQVGVDVHVAPNDRIFVTVAVC